MLTSLRRLLYKVYLFYYTMHLLTFEYEECNKLYNKQLLTAYCFFLTFNLTINIGMSYVSY